MAVSTITATPIAALSSDNNNSTENSEPISGSATQATTVGGNNIAATNRVQVGGGNATIQYYRFSPQTVEINAGQSVTWYSPAQGIAELHTVTFVLDKSLNSDIILPFKVTNNTNFELVPPANIGEPLTIQIPNNTTATTAIMALNKLAFNPSFVTGQDNRITYLNGTDIQYTLKGTEKAVNSGIIQPQSASQMFAGQQGEQPSGRTGTTSSSSSSPPMQDLNTTNPIGNTNSSTGTSSEEQQATAGDMAPPFPFVNNFTVTFEQPGTYDYFCALHPWMNGQVIVKEAGNQTGTSK
jgi:plastocyanin